jgi:glutamate-ammonia-ligase adenylyltransferase
MVTSALTVADLDAQLGEEYRALPAAERERHLALLAEVTRPDAVALDVVPLGDGRWRATVCMADALGALSLLAGLFTALRLDIVRADIFTFRARSHPPAGRHRWRRSGGERPEPSRKLLDIFEVHDLTAGSAAVWERFAADLRRLVAARAAGDWDSVRAEIIDRVSAVFRDAEPGAVRVRPVQIEVTNDPGSTLTRVMVRSADNLGFLFAFTNALAGITVNIERATIRTDDGEAVDTFWVTDTAGRQIASEEQLRELRVATALIKQFTDLLPHSPDPGQALHQFGALIQQVLSRPQWTAELADLESPAVLETLAELMGVSRFLWEDFLRLQHENLFPLVLDPGGLGRPVDRAQLEARIEATLAPLASHPAKVDALNTFKDREMFRIDLRHITGRSTFQSFSRELTDLAEIVIEKAAQLGYEDLVRRYGEPLASGGPCRWVIGALGKFGGAELGFGSDLEIVLVFEEEGETAGPPVIRNSQFFAQQVLALKESVRAREQGIFQLDLRLRPYGEAGALASSLGGFASYYTPGGGAEQFERLALVRLRPVAGDRALGERLIAQRDAFVYADRPLDFDNIRHLRRRQATELVPRGRTNAKYSPGGLVDIEYFVQAWQIGAGRKDPAVRVTSTLLATERLREGGHLPAPLVAEIQATYGFLRQLIDALRVVRGHAKDLTIPDDQPRELAYLAHRLGIGEPAQLLATTRQRMAFAARLWEGPLPRWD